MMFPLYPSKTFCLCSTFATGPKPRISFARLTFMQIKAFASQLLPGSVRKPFTLWRDTHRMSFPEFQLSRHSKVRVFGGITANNEAVNMPKNYIALTCQIQMSFFSNYPTRILHDPVAQSANVVDYIFKFKQSRRPFMSVRCDARVCQEAMGVSSKEAWEDHLSPWPGL